jgi:hypothetical protein
MISIMETNHIIDVTSLDALHRRALEDVIGVQLQANQRLVIGVTDAVSPAPAKTARRMQTLDDWRAVYAGLTDAEIEEIDRIVNTRSDLTRELP